MNQESVVACCAVCNQITHRRCARCLCVYYCNTEHQRQDWRRHKGECLPKLTNPQTSQEKVKNIGSEKVIQQDLTSADLTQKSVQREDTKTAGSGSVKRRSKKTKRKNGKKVYDKLTTQVLNNIAEKQNDVVASDASDETVKAGPSSKEASVISSVVYTNQELSQGSAITYEGSSEQEILSESAQQLNMVDFATPATTDILRTVNMVDIAVPVQANYGVENVSRKEYPEASLRGATAPFNYTPNSYHVDTSDPSYIICQRVIKDMTRFGVCVIDNFFGKDRGANVLNEVKEMHRANIFTAGQLVSNRDSTEPQTIRSDRITWIDGNEPQCYHIRQLISQVDNIVLMANKVPDNGKMGDYFINGRTKAMVACYPGSGSHYVKHVDNPNKDGRCITAIYYLNQDWDINKSGGLLRVFPSGTNKVADIAPIFDRMLFFWSDRRNPHEVQPAYDTRYAITLWYFDAQERAEARRNFMQRGQPSTSN